MIELVALAVKNNCVGGDRDIFMSMFSVDHLGFGAELYKQN